MLNLSLLRQPGSLLLDHSHPHDHEAQGSNDENGKPATACLLFVHPVRELVATTYEEVRDILRALDEAIAGGFYVAGLMTYEAGWTFAPSSQTPVRPTRPARAPLAWFGVYEAPIRLHPSDIEAALAALRRPSAVASPLVHDAQFTLPKDAYGDAIHAIREHIREGDVYQINYTGPVHFQSHGDPLRLYAALRTKQRVQFGAYLNMGIHPGARVEAPAEEGSTARPDQPAAAQHVLSFSPELFFKRRGPRITARPMKGTIRRGRTLAEDQALRAALAADPKNRAENLMIVDLLRNDLSRCCVPGSVRVPELFTTEPYETITQMTSTVEGELRPQTSYSDLFAALFPCGSITGAPKLRAMQIIDALETSPRGVYCGTIGYAGPNDEATFNVAIRTLVLEETSDPSRSAPMFTGRMGIGSGVVWDSDPDTEYEECILKASFLSDIGDAPSEDFQLIETMRWENGHIELLNRHIARLASSAAYFDFTFDEDAVRAYIRSLIEAFTEEAGPPNERSGAYKVRITLDRWGRTAGSVHAITPPAPFRWRVTLAEERIDAGNPFFYHKTTRRDLYERAYQTAQHAGFDEALLLNTRGELTEGTRTNVFLEMDGQLYTPPVESGLLNGVYRQHVLATHPRATERILTLDDLKAADAVYCCNAVQGWQQATFIAPVPCSD